MIHAGRTAVDEFSVPWVSIEKRTYTQIVHGLNVVPELLKIVSCVEILCVPETILFGVLIKRIGIQDLAGWRIWIVDIFNLIECSSVFP